MADSTDIAADPVLDCAGAKAWEADLLVDADREWAAMQRAGTAIARSVLEDLREIGGWPAGGRLLVLVGKGHNGGDALIATAAILNRHRDATAVVVLVFPEDAMRLLARRALDELREHAGVRVSLVGAESALAQDERYTLGLDGVFGFQFRAPLAATVAALFTRVNGHPGIRLRAAVDLPSGLGEGGSSEVLRADFTYATGIVKAPVLRPDAAAAVGRLRYLDLGFFARAMPPANESILTPGVLAPLGRLRSAQTDKRTFGHLLILGGSRSYPGAVMLAARSALHSGAGLVTAFVPSALAPEYAAAQPEIMWVGCPETATGGVGRGAVALVRERMARATALLVGPGLGAEPEVLAMVREVVAATILPVVLDADALRPEILREVRARPFVCTPHAGELARVDAELFQAGRFVPARGVLVRKGPRTSVVAPGGRVYHCLFGGPVLARGGSGDLLAGLIGGLLAQAPSDPLAAACRGVVWHGLAADLLARAHGQVAVEISALLHQLGPALHPDHGRHPDRAAGVHDFERPPQHRADFA